MKTPLILNADSYKVSHWMQLPKGTEYGHSYIESRGGFSDNVMFFGLQKVIKDNLTTPITMNDVVKAKAVIDKHLGEGIFNEKGWVRLLEKHNGYLPLRIRAIREGSIVPTKTALVTVENTDPEFAWAQSYLETLILRSIWYGTTVATISMDCKNTIKKYLDKYSDDPSAIDFMLHDFGYRGVSSDESAQIGGLAHLLNFKGSDTMAAMIAAMEYYKSDGDICYSVIASEHSTMCSNADAENRNDFLSAEKLVSILEKRCKETGTFQIVSAVADTYDVYRFTKQFIGTDLKERIANSGGRFVVRPDSGDATVVPVDLVESLMECFGYTINSKNMKVLPPCIRVLQGDGITKDTIGIILENAAKRGISPCNFVFGMGGALLQHCDRDWLKFAMKCSAICVDGQWRDVFKDPITDSGKTSKKGRLTTVRTIGDEIKTVRISEVKNTDVDLMWVVYENGVVFNQEDFNTIRNRANITNRG